MTSSSFLIRYGAEPTPDEFTVHYEPGSIGLGLTTEENVPGVSVLAVREGSHSQKDGRIEQGHRIMAVNGVDVSNATQEEAVEVIKRATGDHFFLTFAETTVTAPVVPVKEDKKEAPGEKEETATEYATNNLVVALMKSKKLKTCTEEEANSAIRAVGLDKDAARKFILAAREQQQQQQQPLGSVNADPGLMRVTVPAGVSGGQAIRIQVPGKGLMQVTVPPGLGPGSVFQIRTS